MKTIIKMVLIFTLALFQRLFTLSPAGSLIAQHPELATIDTLVLKDTIPIPLAEADTCLMSDLPPNLYLFTQGGWKWRSR